MKLRKNEIKVPMNFSVPPWEIPFSSVGNSIFMPMKILAVLKLTVLFLKKVHSWGGVTEMVLGLFLLVL